MKVRNNCRQNINFKYNIKNTKTVKVKIITSHRYKVKFIQVLKLNKIKREQNV